MRRCTLLKALIQTVCSRHDPALGGSQWSKFNKARLTLQTGIRDITSLMYNIFSQSLCDRTVCLINRLFHVSFEYDCTPIMAHSGHTCFEKINRLTIRWDVENIFCLCSFDCRARIYNSKHSKLQKYLSNCVIQLFVMETSLTWELVSECISNWNRNLKKPLKFPKDCMKLTDRITLLASSANYSVC